MNVWLSEIWRAWRASLRRPGFLLLATGVLALGIGASVAVFTLIDQVLMQPLPIPDPSRVVVIGVKDSGQLGSVSPQQYQHMQGLQGVASIGLTFSGPPVNISGGGQPAVVSAAAIDRGVLPTLGLRPLLGRNFTTEEDQPNGPHVVMLGHGFWQRRYGGNAKVLGQTLLVKGSSYTIVGVLPTSFDATSFGADLVMPLALRPNSQDDGTNYTAVARLAPGTSASALAAEVNTRMHAMYVSLHGYAFDEYWLHKHFGAQPISAWVSADAHAALSLFMACALFVLLTALVNLVNLMMLRSLSRAHDNAVRGALGAPLLRLALPALAESLLVGVAGALAGTILARVGLGLLQDVVSAGWLPTGGLRMPPWIWLAALGAGATVSMLAATPGLWRSQRTLAVDQLREGGRNGLGRRAGLIGRVLVMAQMVLATALLCGTGLLLHGLYKATNTPLGFASANILAFDLAPVHADYPDPQSVNALSQRLVRRLQVIPGVTTAVATTNLPTGTFMEQFNMSVHKPGSPPPSNNPQYRAIGRGFFKLFDIPVLRGRTFNHDDVRGGEAVALVNRALAEQMYGGHAVGQLIEQGSGAQVWSARIVGVVGDTRQFGPLRPAPAMLYVPLAQVPDFALRAFRSFYPMRFVLRGNGNPDAWRPAVRAAMNEVAPNQPISNFRSMTQVVRTTTADTRQTLLLVGIFAGVALLLAVAGMYAVMAVAVAAREREFGVRKAMGANPLRLMWLVLRGGLVQILVGLAIGVAVVLGVSKLLVQMLAELVGRTNTFDPVALISVCVVLAIAGLAACLLPALRASRVQPMRALRGE